MDTTLEPKLILKYIFKSNSQDLNLYTNFYNLIQFYNATQLTNHSKLYYDININNNYNNLLYFILYSQILKYTTPAPNILNMLDSKITNENNNENFSNIENINKYIYCYTFKQTTPMSFLNVRNSLITGTNVYFQLLFNKLCYLKDFLSEDDIDKLITFNNIKDIDNYIIELVFKKKKCLFLTTDSKLISILIGFTIKVIVKHYKNSIIYSDKELINIRDTILSNHIKFTEKIYCEQNINTILQNFNIINPDKLFGHILNLYFDTFLISNINKNIMDKVINDINSIFNKNDRHSINLRKFKNYFIESPFID